MFTGWWFAPDCGSANPNGVYLNVPVHSLLAARNDNNPTMVWNTGLPSYMTWRGEDYPLKKISMQIAPMEAINAEVLKLYPEPQNVKEPVITDNIENAEIQKP